MTEKENRLLDGELYLTSLEKGSFFNRMLHGGEKFNMWAEKVLKENLPRALFNDLKEGLAFFCGSHAGGSHVPKSVVEGREIIIISERQIPPPGNPEDKQLKVEEFTRVVLHETAHAYLKHKSQFFDNLTQKQANQQEDDADELTNQWLKQR